MEITTQDFVEFFEEKKHGTYHCPFCNSANFNVNLNGTNAAEMAIQALPPPGIMVLQGTHNFYAFSCVNCGHTDFFHKIQMEQWKAKKVGNK